MASIQVTLAKEKCELCDGAPVSVESIVQQEVCHEFVAAGCEGGRWVKRCEPLDEERVDEDLLEVKRVDEKMPFLPL